MESNIEQLSKLAELKKKKIITAEEFEAQKKALLSRNLKDLGVKSSKSQLVYDLLAYLLGSLGVHNFYAGYKKRGFIQLFLTLSIVFVFLVTLISIFMTEKNAVLMSEDIFYELFFTYPVVYLGMAVSAFICGWVAYDIYTVSRTANGEVMEPAPTGRIIFFILQLLSFMYQLSFVFIN